MKQFDGAKAWNRHVMQAHPDRQFVCAHCDAIFLTESDADQHVADVHNVRLKTGNDDVTDLINSNDDVTAKISSLQFIASSVNACSLKTDATEEAVTKSELVIHVHVISQLESEEVPKQEIEIKSEEVIHST